MKLRRRVASMAPKIGGNTTAVHRHSITHILQFSLPGRILKSNIKQTE